MVRRAKAKGLNVTCEVTSQHLSFTDEYLREYNPAFKMAPPIRSEDHRQALLEGLKDGTIDAIITDHAPHAYEEKTMSSAVHQMVSVVSKHLWQRLLLMHMVQINLASTKLYTI